MYTINETIQQGAFLDEGQENAADCWTNPEKYKSGENDDACPVPDESNLVARCISGSVQIEGETEDGKANVGVGERGEVSW